MQTEADHAGLGRQSGEGRGDQKLPVPDRGDGHALALAGPLDTPPHRACRRAGPATAIPVEEDRPVRLLQHVHARASVQLAVAVESGQKPERRDPVVGMAAKLRVDQEPAQSLGALRHKMKALEGNREAASQVIDPHQPRAFELVVGHQPAVTIALDQSLVFLRFVS